MLTSHFQALSNPNMAFFPLIQQAEKWAHSLTCTQAFQVCTLVLLKNLYLGEQKDAWRGQSVS